jgi:hypothetical protein
MRNVALVVLCGLIAAGVAGMSLGACSNVDAPVGPTGPDAATSTPEASADTGADATADGPPPVGGGTCTFDPSRIDVPGNALDEDCSGAADDEDLNCDGPLVLSSTDAFDAAKAIGLCRKTVVGSPSWGVIDARYVLPDGTAAPGAAVSSWGLLPSFGTNAPHAGQRLLALSSGNARAPDQPNYQAPGSGFNKGYSHALPSGFPSQLGACSGLPLAAPHDGIALEVRLLVPSNAKSFSFSHQFFTTDYGDNVCQSFSDVYGVLLASKPAGSADGNVVLDPSGSVLSAASTAFIRACAPGMHGGLTFLCPMGGASLTGTGFETHAATGWLKTTVPVAGGEEITLRFAIWDSGDGAFDSTVLFDDFAFSTVAAAMVSTVAQ